MKASLNLTRLFAIVLFSVLCLSCSSPGLLQHSTAVSASTAPQAANMAGAWRLVAASDAVSKLGEGITAVKIASDGYFTIAFYNQTDKKFLGTYGGTYLLSNGTYTETYEFNTWDSTQVGTSSSFQVRQQQGRWQLSGSGNQQQTWERLDQANTQTPLAGAWRITGRAGQDGKVNAMQQGARKTIKFLSGSRFQWVAYNTETKQFSGTGGGTYTAANGKYTETIDFFSRDPKRVGAVLSFDYEVKGNEWHHKGLSSTGSPIYEIWTKQ
ncbi:membrane or secreted protein [Pontibacter sp. SGAir0037]|uniref:membrane or secreted protein n=1 Tax=Pontibacter sp. SGAir0037 TaxID=2571030 RepID=UPI00197D369D|nr:membrane or secreted protein [Pontibacter sp. SGAir0037]